MTGCPDCGQQTPRSGRCKQCAVIDRHEPDEPLQTSATPYECTACGAHYQTDGNDPCPECGARRRRYAGELATDGGTDRELAAEAMIRWLGRASRNINEWGLQDEETLLLAMQEELGELTQAFLEAHAEDGDPQRIDEELADLGALLIQLHKARNSNASNGGEPR